MRIDKKLLLHWTFLIFLIFVLSCTKDDNIEKLLLKEEFADNSNNWQFFGETSKIENNKLIMECSDSYTDANLYMDNLKNIYNFKLILEISNLNSSYYTDISIGLIFEDFELYFEPLDSIIKDTQFELEFRDNTIEYISTGNAKTLYHRYESSQSNGIKIGMIAAFGGYCKMEINKIELYELN